MKFWILWGFDALIALVVLFFFVAGLADGRVSSLNILLWMVLLLGVAGVVGGALWLRSKARRGPAMAVLLVLTIPGFLCVLFFLVVLIGHPRWN